MSEYQQLCDTVAIAPHAEKIELTNYVQHEEFANKSLLRTSSKIPKFEEIPKFEDGRFLRRFHIILFLHGMLYTTKHISN